MQAKIRKKGYSQVQRNTDLSIQNNKMTLLKNSHLFTVNKFQTHDRPHLRTINVQQSARQKYGAPYVSSHRFHSKFKQQGPNYG